MGDITLTLQEILEIPNYNLFMPHRIHGYERLQGLIINKFLNREIAYDTPDYFKLKLNYYLEVNAERYNKMLLSEAIEFDPFLTDYREHMESHAEGTAEGQHIGISAHAASEGTEYGTNRSREHVRELAKGNTTDHASKATTGTEGTLYSSDENGAEDKALNQQKGFAEGQHTSEKSTNDKAWTETKDTTEHMEYEDNKDVQRDIDLKSDREQTAREWTEKGNSKAHNLSVNSDTPQAMLFNVPNHYYGAGTAHDEGVVVNTSEGQAYQPFLEEDIDALESTPRQINGGDTPWFNYASNAGNNLGHDNYNRSGTETYKQNQHDVTSDHTESYANGTKDTAFHSQTDGYSGEVGTKETQQDTASLETIGSTEGTLSSNAFNSNEHSLRNGLEHSQSNRDNRTERDNRLHKAGQTSKREESKQHKGTTTDSSKSGTKEGWRQTVDSGRSMKSPSKLLEEYRNVLTYSADLFLLGELEDCFLQLY